MVEKNKQSKDLQKIITSWNKDIVNQLIKELGINHEDVKKIMITSNGVLSRKPIRNRYETLLEYSDLFGLPVWSLMTDETAEEVMSSVKEELDENIKPYRISDLEEILNYVSIQSGDLSLSNTDKTHVKLFVNKLKEILKRHERWSETWRILFSQNKDGINKWGNYDSICNLLFTYNNEVIYRGTLRFYQKSLTSIHHKPSNMKDRYTTSWFFLKKMIPTAEKPRLILSIIDDISTGIFNCYQPNISINTQDENELFFSWNSNFKQKVVTLPDLTSNFRNRMSELNALSVYKAFQINEHFYRNDSDWTSPVEDDKSNVKESIEGTFRKHNTFVYLLHNGYIKDGDQILFKNEKRHSYFEFAEIIIANKKPMLLWRGEIYHFTTLTNKLLGNQLNEETPNYCAKYWYLPNRQYSLYELANFIKMLHKF